MKTKILLAFAIIASAALLSGCASQKTRGGKDVSVVGGLYHSKEGCYVPPQANTIDNYNFPHTVNSNPSGKQVSVLWGLFTYTDY